MTTIVTRSGKGSPLTHTEVDTNFTNLNTNKFETAAIPLGTLAAPSISFVGDANTGIYSPGADTVAFVTAGSNRVHITSAGLVGIGTSAPTTRFHVDFGDAAANSIRLVGDGATNGAALATSWFSGSSYFDVRLGENTTSETKLRVQSNGNVGIGTTTVSAKLHIAGATGGGVAGIWDTTAGGARVEYKDNGTRRGYLNWDTNSLLLAADSGNSIKFSTNAGVTQHATIDSSGRLLVGTTTSFDLNTALQINNALAASFYRIGADDGQVYIGAARGTVATPTTLVSTDFLGSIHFRGHDGTSYMTGARIRAEIDGITPSGDLPTRLVFSTCPDSGSSPVERMRIANNGVIQARNVAGDTLNLYNAVSAGSSNAFIYGLHSSASVYAGTTSFIVYTNGNVVNTNGSYTTISDAKLKENIVDAGSQWDDFKAIQIRNWNFKAETGHETHRQIGPIAQELETVCPGLVFETPDRDPKGNDLGTTTKGVNQSVLYMKAVKALQEAMGRIETLEARLTAAGID